MKIDITKLPTYYINLDEERQRRKSMERLLIDNGFKNIKRFNIAEDNIETIYTNCCVIGEFIVYIKAIDVD